MQTIAVTIQVCEVWHALDKHKMCPLFLHRLLSLLRGGGGGGEGCGEGGREREREREGGGGDL